MEFSLFWPCLEVILGHILATGARRSRKFFSKKNFSRQNDRPRTNFQSFPWKMEIFHLGLARRWLLATGAHCSRILAHHFPLACSLAFFLLVFLALVVGKKKYSSPSNITVVRMRPETRKESFLDELIYIQKGKRREKRF